MSGGQTVDRLSFLFCIAWSEVRKIVAPAAAIGFFYQAADGIRVTLVIGVQTCALPINPRGPGKLLSSTTGHRRSRLFDA